MEEPKKLRCCKCQLDMVSQLTDFSYLGHIFSTKLPKCPQCGLVYIDEELVKGRISEVEMQLEDK